MIRGDFFLLKDIRSQKIQAYYIQKYKLCENLMLLCFWYIFCKNFGVLFRKYISVLCTLVGNKYQVLVYIKEFIDKYLCAYGCIHRS